MRTGVGMERWLIAVAASLASALAAGCGGGGEAAPVGGRGGPGAGTTPPTAVEVAAVERGSISRAVTVSGTIEPIRTIRVNSQLSGALLAVEAEEGDVVQAGEVLARLDDRELSAQLESAEATLEVSRAAFERAERLRERRVITLPEYERDRTAYAAAQAQVEQLRTRIDFATVRAPVSGIVTEKRVEAGAIVGSQTPLFTIADVSLLVTRVGISELDVVDLAEGDPADVVLDAFPGRPLRGRIRRIFPTADPTTRLVPVEVALVGDEAGIARPGFLARVTFALGTREGALLVPSSAIVGGTGPRSVFVLEGDQAISRTVTTGMTSGNRVEITAGLAEGDTVITLGSNMVRDGMTVRVVHGDAETVPADREGGGGS